MKLLSIILLAFFVVGCSSVPTMDEAATINARAIPAPSEGNAGIYIYRDSMFGSALKKDLWVNGECIGESAPKTFFVTEVEGGKEHTVSTESEFSPNHLSLNTEVGQTYFIEQYIKMGVMVGGADLEQVPFEEGKKAIQELKLAVAGNCSSKFE